ncbi:MAG: acyl-CoA dehydrogenase family protein [Thermoleophilaceae bacterium]|nr:acyl-CoA dehydrogenase family protein [Thermoleophilaceae bacterium]
MPRASGGTEHHFCVRSSLLIEEVATGCSGVATIYGAHALGANPLLFGGPIFWDGVLRELATSEREGDPQIMAFAITEPSAGTDVEHHELIRSAQLMTQATQVDGGFLLSGTKHFISNGSVARWVTVMMPVDPKHPDDSMTGFLVDARSDGFKVGHVEHKMGQRACPAAELIFDEVFVPDECVIGKVGDGMVLTIGVLAGSRPVVGAIATGIARGAYERLLEWLQTDPAGAELLERQQVQLALAQMEEQIHLSRQAYLDAASEFDMVSIGAIQALPSVRALGAMPRVARTNPISRRVIGSDLSRGAVMQIMARKVGDGQLARSLALSSLAKARGADTAMFVTGLALEIAGLDCGALRPELEKLLRDAKLTQIYEGTNQLNRLEVFDALVTESSMHVMQHALDTSAERRKSETSSQETVA